MPQTEEKNPKNTIIEMPKGHEEVVVHVEPRSKLSVEGISFSESKIDIVEGDVIVQNPATGARVVIPGLALMLFDAKEAPALSFNGEEISLNAFMSKLGVVGNITEEQFITFSTLGTQTDPLASELQEKIKGLEKQLEEARKKVDETEKTVEELKDDSDQVISMAMSFGEDSEEGRYQEEPIDDRRIHDGKYDFEGIPLVSAVRFSSNDKSSSTSSALSNSDAENEEEVPPDDLDQASISFFAFKAFLLQTGIEIGVENVEGTDRTAIYGGGGSQAATFNPDNEHQYSAETIDYASSTDDLVVYADDPTYFLETMATRVIEVSATTPDGFSIISGVISGLPAGYSIEGGTLQGDGSYLLNTVTTNDRGDIRLVLSFPIPRTENFEMEIAFTAEFDEESGVVPVPKNSVQTYELSQLVEVKDVASSNDLNYVNGDGKTVWVLANQMNGNTILTGTGDDIIHGSFVDDVIRTSAGEDRLIGSAGDDIFDGGLGADTIDYTGFSDSITLDLSTLVGGYTAVSVGGGKTDHIVNVENVIGGSGNDTLIGDNNNNIFEGGDGNDTFSGALGVDTFDGGNGTDTVSFRNGATTGLNVDLQVAIVGQTINVGTGLKTLISIENIVATDFDDIILGSTANNVLSGAGGSDYFGANSGQNSYDGGYDGVDASTGDSIDYSASTAALSLNLGGATDGNGFVTANAGAWATDLIKGIEHVTGTGLGDTITGNNADNTIRGGAGNDTLNGGGGNDLIYGGTGSDTMDGGTGYNTLRFDDLTGTSMSLVYTAATTGIATRGAETDIFTNFQTIYMTSSADTIHTGVGDDQVDGMGGDDLFHASAGNDSYHGSTGTDTLSYAVIPVGSIITTTFVPAGGTITLSGAINATHNITGIDILIGTIGDDVITSGAGAGKKIDGGGGNNTINFGANAVTIDMSSLSGGYYSVSEAVVGTTSLANFKTLNLSSAADTIKGDTSANIINGLNGNDLFRGSKGGDVYDGGGGTDALDYKNGDAATSFVSANMDAGFAVITYNDASTSTDFFANIENLYITSGNDTVLGSSTLSNVIYDAGGDDYIDGNGGTNTIDYSLITATGVQVNLTTNSADDDRNGATDDTILNFRNVNGSNQADILTGDGNANTINGNSGNDEIYGLGGNDTLSGGDGDDILAGGAGTNTLTGGNGTDTLSYAAATGSVTINFSTGNTTAAGNGFGAQDTFSTVEAFIGSDFADTVTVASTTTSLSLALGDDLVYSSTGATSRSISGGGGTDTVSYASRSGILSGTLENGNGTITQGSNNDVVSSIEKFVLGTSSDTISIDTNTIKNVLSLNAASFDSGAGTDRISVFTSGGNTLTTHDIDGDTLAGIFRNTEEIDFRNTDLTGGDTFDISGAQIATINSGTKALKIIIDGTNITFADFNLSGANTLTSDTPTQKIYSWTDGSGSSLTIQTS